MQQDNQARAEVQQAPTFNRQEQLVHDRFLDYATDVRCNLPQEQTADIVKVLRMLATQIEADNSSVIGLVLVHYGHANSDDKETAGIEVNKLCIGSEPAMAAANLSVASLTKQCYDKWFPRVAFEAFLGDVENQVKEAVGEEVFKKEFEASFDPDAKDS